MSQILLVAGPCVSRERTEIWVVGWEAGCCGLSPASPRLASSGGQRQRYEAGQAPVSGHWESGGDPLSPGTGVTSPVSSAECDIRNKCDNDCDEQKDDTIVIPGYSCQQNC